MYAHMRVRVQVQEGVCMCVGVIAIGVGQADFAATPKSSLFLFCPRVLGVKKATKQAGLASFSPGNK